MPNRDSSGRFVSGGGSSKHVSDEVSKEYVAAIGPKPDSIEMHVGVLERNSTGGPSGGDPHDGKSGLTIADLANVHEFGLGVPERSFVRAWVDSSQEKINAKVAEILPQAMSGALTWQQAGDQIALWAGAEVQKFISDGKVQPADSAETIKRKGSSTPLLDTNLLRSAISGEAILK